MSQPDPKTIWTQTDAGRWCAEISDLQGNGLLKGDVLTLPDGRQTKFSSFAGERFEGEVLQWHRRLEGEDYIIFND